MTSQSLKVVTPIFENYARSQSTFVKTVAGLVANPRYAGWLYQIRMIETVGPLMSNADDAVRSHALLGLARLAGHSAHSAKQILRSKDLLDGILGQISRENKHYIKSCMKLIKNLSKHSFSLSSLEVCEGIRTILTCLKNSDIYIKEVTLKAIISFVRQDTNLLRIVIKSGVLPQIIRCLNEKRHRLKLYALSTLDEIAKHSQAFAQIVVNASTLPHVINFLAPDFTDLDIQRIALTLIKNIVKHSSFLTNKTIESNLLPEILLLTEHPDESIRDKSAIVIHELVKHTAEISQMIVDAGGIFLLMRVISSSKEFPSNPAILALGQISSKSPSLALAVIQSKALIRLAAVLKSDTNNEYTKAATAWTLGMIGQHGPKHSKIVCACGVLTDIINIYRSSSIESNVLHTYINAIELILSKCEDFTTVDKLLRLSTTPAEIIPYILEKMSKIFPKNSKARRTFITNGCLKMIQNLKPETDSDLFTAIKAVNCCFPKDVIKMVTGGYPESVMKKVDKYVPKSQSMLYDGGQ